MSGEQQYKFKGGREDGNKARRLNRIKSSSVGQGLKLQGEGAYPQRILITFNGVKIKALAAELRGIRAVHPEATSKRQLLDLVPEESRDLYRRAINVMQKVASDGKTIYELGEAIVRSETLPDGTVREMQPECKYLNSAPTGE